MLPIYRAPVEGADSLFQSKDIYVYFFFFWGENFAMYASASVYSPYCRATCHCYEYIFVKFVMGMRFLNLSDKVPRSAVAFRIAPKVRAMAPSPLSQLLKGPELFLIMYMIFLLVCLLHLVFYFILLAF